MRHWLTLACSAGMLLLSAAACAVGTYQSATPISSVTLIAPNQLPTSRFVNDPVVRLGEDRYNLICGHCHGYDGEGQLPASIPTTEALGMRLVPAQDSTGNTWRYPDQLLRRVIREGIQNPLDHFPMPAFGAALTDEEIDAIIAYMKLWWTDDQRAYQARLTESWAAREAQVD